MGRLRELLYKRGVRPRPGGIFYSPSLEIRYVLIDHPLFVGFEPQSNEAYLTEFLQRNGLQLNAGHKVLISEAQLLQLLERE